MNILVVEDERIIALDIKQRLGRLGYHVVGTTGRAETALKLVHESAPQLVLMDIHLSGEVSGIELATQIRNRFHLPVVFLTAHADEATVNQAIAAQPYGYIVKPFEDHDLNTAIQIAFSNHQAEISIQKALEQEKQLNALKSQFISVVSHEFRNPLNSIILALNLVEQQDAWLTSEKRLPHLQHAKAAAEGMLNLIEDMLVIGDVDREQFQCRPAPLDLVWFCRDIVEFVQLGVGAKHQMLLKVTGCLNDVQPFYQFDARLLQHILSNLLSNAVKYSPEGSEVSLEVQCEPESATFVVQDHGVGIDEIDFPHLFTPFYRGINVGRTAGTGLGLSIVKWCVDAHGGSVTVDSQVHTGTTFTVKIHQIGAGSRL